MATSAKQQAIDVIERLPGDATLEEVMERLYFLAKVQRGLEQIDVGRVVSHEEFHTARLFGAQDLPGHG